MMTPLERDCPECGAIAGNRCKAKGGGFLGSYHTARLGDGNPIPVNRPLQNARAPSAAIHSLHEEQRQLDADGVEVGVSRQALDELLAYVGTGLPEAKACDTDSATTGDPVRDYAQLVDVWWERLSQTDRLTPAGSGLLMISRNELVAFGTDVAMLALDDAADPLPTLTARAKPLGTTDVLASMIGADEAEIARAGAGCDGPFKADKETWSARELENGEMLAVMDGAGEMFAYVQLNDCAGMDKAAAKARATRIAEALNRAHKPAAT